MRIETVLGMTLLLVGCANPRAAQPAVTPATQTAGADALLQSLITTRDTALAEAQEIEARLEEHRRNHPQLDDQRDVSKQRLMQVAQALTAAELAVIDVRATYAEGHPAVAAAQRREAEIRKLYDDALAQLARINTPTADRERLVGELSYKQELIRRLNDRIRSLELVAGPRA